ncbi:MAG: recombinase family protein [Neomegalonema sp.]|nr:recombinase family protein [Neomegalonema sp.]
MWHNDSVKIGYLRVSTEEQDTARQEDGLAALCDELHVERLSAVAKKRPVFDSVVAKLGEGGSLIVWDLDRAFRSPVDIPTCVADLNARGVKFQIVTLGIDTATEAGERVATMMAAVAQFERRIISRRTKEGMAARMRRGGHLGRALARRQSA